MSFAQQSGVPNDPRQVRELLKLFFGEQIASEWSAGDPHGLLGLDCGVSTPAAVITALQDRLTVLRLHPLAESPAGQAVEAVLKQAASVAMLGGPAGAGGGTPKRISEIAAERKLAEEQSALQATREAVQEAVQESVQEAVQEPVGDAAQEDAQKAVRVAVQKASASEAETVSNIPTQRPPQPIRPGDGQTFSVVANDGEQTTPRAGRTINQALQVNADGTIAATVANSVGNRPTAAAHAPVPARAQAKPTDAAMNLLRQRAVMILTARGRLDVDAMRQLHAAALGLKLPISAAELVVSEMARGGGQATGAKATMILASGAAGIAPTKTTESVWARPGAYEPAGSADDETDPASVLLKRVIIGGGLVVMLVLSGLTFALLRSGRASVNTANPPIATSGAASTGKSEIPTVATLPAPVKPVLMTAVDRSSIVPEVNAALVAASTLRAMSEARTTAPIQSEVSQAIVAFTRSWPRMQSSQRTATAEHAIDAILRLDALGQLAIINALGGAAELSDTVTAAQIVEKTGSGGLLGRLVREREFSASLRETIRKQLASAGGGEGGAFDGAAAAVLRGVPLRLVGGQETGPTLHLAWEAITLCGAALAGGTTARGDGAEMNEADRIVIRETAGPFLLEALEQLIRGGPNPLAVRSMHDSLIMAAEQLTWSAGSASRGRLINWFDDSSVPTVKLGIVTAAIVQRSGAEGVDLTMAMSSSADVAGRQEARARYAEAWKLVGGPSDATHQKLSVKLATLVTAADSDAARLLVAAIAADVNRFFLTRFTTGASSDVEPSVPDTLTANVFGQSGQSGNRFRTVSLAGETAEAMDMPAGESPSNGVRYFAERNTQARTEIIRQFDTRGPLDPVDADALIDAAAFGSSTELRALAARSAAARSGEAILTASLLEVLPRLTRSRASAELISSLTLQQVPDSGSPEYPLAIRRVVVGRLIELLAAETPVTDVEGQAQKIAEAYRFSAGAIGSAIRSTDASGVGFSGLDAASMAEVAAGNGPADAAQAVFLKLRSRALLLAPSKELVAAGLNLAAIDSRAASRATAATGPVRRFAGWQVSLLELTAFVAGADRPTAAGLIGTLLAEAADRRQRATGLAQQIMHTEVSMVRMWLAWEAAE